ncbi:Phosphoglycolate phosphatase [Burkholderia sp. AD24]|nr:Phosphoglycolate phosphatase [Burkholderia sp. AD24]
MRTPTSPRRRPHIAGGKPVWLFDLDNTLHHASHEIFPAINQGMTQYIVDTLNVDVDVANRMRRAYTQRYGAALLGLTRHHPLDPHDFLKFVHTFPDLGSMIRYERGVARLIAALPGRKIVLTNAPEAYARAVLAELRIERLFEQVIAIEHMADRRRWRAKPDHAMLRKTMRDAHVALKDVILVEDTRSHLKHYRRLGIRTVWITGHLPRKPHVDGVPTRLPGTGRPHYVDQSIRSLKSLRLGTRSVRLKGQQTGRQPCSRSTSLTKP